MTIRSPLSTLFAALLLAGCGSGASDGPIEVVAIGGDARLTVPARDEAPAPNAVLLLAVAQGLVAFDAAGQLEPALAQRWIVSDDGRSYIFRLRDAEWREGRKITADELARRLRAITAPGSRNRLAPLFGAIDQIVAVTPEILEIRLKAPRPQFLALLAQPETALLSGKIGSGPFRMAADKRGGLLLTPAIDAEQPDEAQARYPVRMRHARAAVALVHFDREDADLILGGRFADLPYARVINPPNAQLRFDPAMGLFGLAVVGTRGFLESADNREAISMAIDRAAMIRAFAVPGWRAVYSMVPARLDLAAPPARPDWVTMDREQRIAAARARVAAWRGNNTQFPRLRVGLPPGAGSQLLFNRIALDMGQIGIIAERVGMNADADLRLIDEIAPNDSATWYLTRLSCANGLPCGETGDAALSASRVAGSLAERSAKLSEADAAYLVNMPFIPLASPVRWSLVGARLNGFATNARAAHPLHRLLKE